MSQPRGFIPSELCMNYKTNIKICTTLDTIEKETVTHSMFLPGESQGQESLMGCCLWGSTESDTTEAT